MVGQGDRDVPRAAPYLRGSAAFLANGCQVAQDQLGGFGLPRAALPTETQSRGGTRPGPSSAKQGATGVFPPKTHPSTPSPEAPIGPRAGPGWRQHPATSN